MSDESKSSRGKFTKVKTARGRKNSSTRWLQRQLNDPYVQRAKKEGYRSRAAFKLIELDEKFHFLKPGQVILDLGSAPGGWSQVCGKHAKNSRVVALDLLEMEPITGVDFRVMDFMDDDAPDLIKAWIGGGVDVVLSDMAPNASGTPSVDHLRIMGLCEVAVEFAYEILNPGGSFVCKVLQGGTEGELLNKMKREFQSVKHAKPKASRKDSSESYVVAMGFKGT